MKERDKLTQDLLELASQTQAWLQDAATIARSDTELGRELRKKAVTHRNQLRFIKREAGIMISAEAAAEELQNVSITRPGLFID